MSKIQEHSQGTLLLMMKKEKTPHNPKNPREFHSHKMEHPCKDLKANTEG